MQLEFRGCINVDRPQAEIKIEIQLINSSLDFSATIKQ